MALRRVRRAASSSSACWAVRATGVAAGIGEMAAMVMIGVPRSVVHGRLFFVRIFDGTPAGSHKEGYGAGEKVYGESNI
ncbi:hypothetical protein GCM10009099_42650 [Caenispirillum bisanense]